MYPPVKLGRYPHMLPADVAIWERFLDKHGAEYAGFDYDIHVGGVLDRKSVWTDEEHKAYSDLVAKRIDAVGYQGDKVTIFEVKPEAGVTAVGQLFTYRELYVKDFKPAIIPDLVLVCSNALHDELYALEQLGAKVVVV